MKDNPPVEIKESVVPRTPAEELIAEIYKSSLKSPHLGVHDSIASLDVSQMAWVRQCLQQIFHVEISADCLRSQTTIDSLISLLSELWGGREIIEEIAWTFLQIEELSDDEVKTQLTEERRGERQIEGN